MGAWGTAPFDNDDAGDWVYALEDDGVAAVAAAAAVALTSGVPVESSEEVDDWLTAADPAALEELRTLATQAAAALHRVLDGSELAELYGETGDVEWRERRTVMKTALQG